MKFKKFLPLIFVGINVLCMIGGLALVYLGTLGSEPAIVKEERELERFIASREMKTEEPLIYTMDKLTVNLDGYPRRIIQTEINLLLLDKQGYEQVIRLGSKGRDSVVRILNGKQFNEIETLQGKLKLKEEIATSLNDLMVEGVIKEVYFTDFIVK